jgi:futalosine hydrolase
MTQSGQAIVNALPAGGLSSWWIRSGMAPERRTRAFCVMTTTLVLVPTDLERRLLAPALVVGGRPGPTIELCGFGPVAAAARTAALLATLAPQRVLLVGIAGRLDDALHVGAAYRFDRVACHGVGAGSGPAFAPAETLGWLQWPGDPVDPAAAVGDVIDLPPAFGSGLPAKGLLLTACAASANAADVAARRSLFPAAEAEDMEGFGVALACRLAGVPLAIVRGISNAAGDRDHARWQVSEAAAAAASLAATLLESPR